MPSNRTVLIALDLSPDSTAVVEGVRRLNLTGNIHVVHVSEHPVTALGSGTGRNHRHGELQVRQELFPRLQSYVESLALLPDHIHILFGDAPQEVTYLAEKLGADLVVVGSHGEKGLRRLLGSTATNILHSAACDVLTVRIHDPQAA